MKSQKKKVNDIQVGYFAICTDVNGRKEDDRRLDNGGQYFNTMQELLDSIEGIVSEDPLYWEDYVFQIAAANLSQTLKVKISHKVELITTQ
jgi:hypothetical protein